MTSHRIVEIRDQFAKAELALKKYERIGLTSIASALNELRYAGQHILAAETGSVPAEIEEHCRRASCHCERAEYDAKEATILALLKWLAHYQQYELTADEMSVFIPGWKNILGQADAARRVIEAIGHARDAADSEIDGALNDLLAARDVIMAALPQINAARKDVLDKSEKKKRALENDRARELDARRKEAAVIEARQFLISFNATVGGTFIGLLGTVIAIACAVPEHRLLGVAAALAAFILVSTGAYVVSKRFLISAVTKQLLE